MGRPEGFPSASEHVLMDRKNAMKVLQEIRQTAFAINNNGVVVIAHGAEPNDTDAKALGADGQAIDEGIGRFSVWPHEEAPLRTTTRDEVTTLRYDGTRKRHAWISSSLAKSCGKN